LKRKILVDAIQLPAQLPTAFLTNGDVQLLLHLYFLAKGIVNQQSHFQIGRSVGVESLVQVILDQLHPFQFGAHGLVIKGFQQYLRYRLAQPFQAFELLYGRRTHIAVLVLFRNLLHRLLEVVEGSQDAPAFVA